MGFWHTMHLSPHQHLRMSFLPDTVRHVYVIAVASNTFFVGRGDFGCSQASAFRGLLCTVLGILLLKGIYDSISRSVASVSQGQAGQKDKEAFYANRVSLRPPGS